jgi:hypothetical protein
MNMPGRAVRAIARRLTLHASVTSPMGRRLLNVLLGFLGLCAGIGSPIAIMVLLLAPHFGWWGATLEKYPWLFVVLVLIFLSRWVVGGWLYYQVGKHLKFLHSPEGQRQKAQEIQESIAAISADAQSERPKIKPNELDPSVFGEFPPSAVMTEAHRLARKAAKDKLRDEGIRMHSVEASEITKIGNALLEAGLLSFIETAKANLKRSNYRSTRRGAPH